MKRELPTGSHVRPYSPPTLRIFGGVAELTASGTGRDENNPGGSRNRRAVGTGGARV